ncbi:hypothetical protein [Staphylococcus xylosus]|nr:hypothetical protein [Staphylococcus xylosus]NQD99284.1 hypothetical protein [Staphylococcus xylosus]
MTNYLKSIAESLYGIHKELIILNKSNPSQQDKKIDDKAMKEQFKPSKFI